MGHWQKPQHRGAQRGNATECRPTLEAQERDKSGGLKGATKTRKQNEATKTGKKRDLENKARKTPLEGARRRNYTTGARPKKPEPKRRSGLIAFICQTKKAPVRKKRDSVQNVDPRTQRATETTQRATGYNPPIGRDGRSPEEPGYRQKKRRGERGAQPRRRDGFLTEIAGRLVGVEFN